MKDSRNLAMMFLLGAFITGGVLGFTANGYMHRGSVCSTGDRSGALMSVLSQRLQLTGSQQHTVDSLLDDRARQYKVVMEPIRPRIDSIKLNAREQIRRVLTDQQNREFEALIQEMSDTTKRTREN